MRSRLAIVGAGGHGRVVLDAVTARSAFTEVVFVDDDAQRAGTRLMGLRVLSRSELQEQPPQFVVAVGDNASRSRIFGELVGAGWLSVAVIHPAAWVSPSASVGVGSVILAGVVVNAGARVGRNVIVNTSASIDHDCVVGDHSHIAPGVHLAGGVVVGERVLVGIGAAIGPLVRVNADAVVGAGAAVLDDVAAGTLVAGSPARFIRLAEGPSRRSGGRGEVG